jgi:hypothetical protein
MNGTGIVELDNLCSEIVDPEEFIRIFNEERESIERVEVIPPKLGDGGFGRIRVVRKHPVRKITWGKFITNEPWR